MATKTVKKLDILDQLAASDNTEIIALMLWKDRRRNPDLTVQITEKDITGWRDSTTYLKVTPQVRIYRPQGLPAQAAIPAAGNRRAVPARAAEPARPFVVVQVIEAKTGDAIKPIENDEEGARRRDEADALRRYRETAPGLARELQQQSATGNFSSSMISEAAEALAALARATG